jgi:hypothetical protein
LLAVIASIVVLGEARAGTARRPLTCGLSALVGVSRIFALDLGENEIDVLASEYPATDAMTLLEVRQELQVLAERRPYVIEATYEELLMLDVPVVAHLVGRGSCADCGDGGHTVAIDRLGGDWAIAVDEDGTHLIPVGELRDLYAGHAITLAEPTCPSPTGPRLTVDTCVGDIGMSMAGRVLPHSIVVRNDGGDPLHLDRVVAGDAVRVLGFPSELAPGQSGLIRLAICPAHRLDRPSEVQTYFIHVYSDDVVRPRSSLALRSIVVQPVRPESPVIYFPSVTPGEPAERTVAIECRRPVELLDAIPSHEALGAEIRQTRADGFITEYEMRLSVRADALTPGVSELPVALRLKGAASQGADLIARVRVWPD